MGTQSTWGVLFSVQVQHTATMQLILGLSLSLFFLAECHPLPASIRRVDHHHHHHHQPHHLGQRLARRPAVGPARSTRHIPHLNPLRGILSLVDQSRRRSQRQPTRLVKTQGHPRRPVSAKAQKPRVVPNFIYLDAEQMPGYEKFEDHEIVRNGKTTVSPYLIKTIQQTKSNYSGLIDERTSKTKISAEKIRNTATEETEETGETEESSEEESKKS